MNIGTMWATLGIDSTGVQHAMVKVKQFEAQTNASLARIQRKWQTVGASMKSFGRSMSQFVTVPMLLAGGAAFKMYKDFEFSMNKVVSLVGIARKQMEAWSKEVLALAPSVGKSPVELADAMYFITSAGIRGKEVLDILNESARSAAGGLGEVKVVADLLTSAMNAYGKANLTASRANDILVATVREGKAEAELLAQSMGLVLPIASAMGSTFDQVGAATAAMTRTGTKAATAAIQLRQIFNSILKPAKEAEKALIGMKTSSEELRIMIKEKGLLAALQKLDELQKEYGINALGKVIPNIRSLTGVLDIMGKNAKANAVIFEEIKNSVGDANKMFEETAHTVQFRLNAAIAGIKKSLIIFGESVSKIIIPVIEKLSKFIQRLMERFDRLSDRQKNLRIKFGAFIMVLGPIITIFGFMIGNVVPGLIMAFSALKSILLATTEQFLAVGAAGTKTNKALLAVGKSVKRLFALMIANPIVALIATLAAVGTALILHNRKIKETARIQEEFSKRGVDATEEQIKATRRMTKAREEAYIQEVAMQERADKLSAPFEKTVSLIEQIDELGKVILTLPELDKRGVENLLAQVQSLGDAVDDEILRLENLELVLQMELTIEKINEVNLKAELAIAAAPMNKILMEEMKRLELIAVDSLATEFQLPDIKVQPSEFVSLPAAGMFGEGFANFFSDMITIPGKTLETDIEKIKNDAVKQVNELTKSVTDAFNNVGTKASPLEEWKKTTLEGLIKLQSTTVASITAISKELDEVGTKAGKGMGVFSIEGLAEEQAIIAGKYLVVLKKYKGEFGVWQDGIFTTWEDIMKASEKVEQSIAQNEIGQSYAKQLQVIQTMGKLTWSELETLEAKVAAASQLLEAYANEGVGPADKRMKELVRDLSKAQERVVWLERDTTDLTEAMNDLQKELASAAMNTASFPEFLPGSAQFDAFEGYLDEATQNVTAFKSYYESLRSRKLEVFLEIEELTGFPFDPNELAEIGGLSMGGFADDQLEELDRINIKIDVITDKIIKWQDAADKITYDDLINEVTASMSKITKVAEVSGEGFDTASKSVSAWKATLDKAVDGFLKGTLSGADFKKFYDEAMPTVKDLNIEGLQDGITHELDIIQRKAKIMKESFDAPEAALKVWENYLEAIWAIPTEQIDEAALISFVGMAEDKIQELMDLIADGKAWEEFLKNAQVVIQSLGSFIGSLEGLFVQQMNNQIRAVEEYAKAKNKSDRWVEAETEKIRQREGKKIKAMAIAQAIINGALAAVNIIASVPGSVLTPAAWAGIALAAATTAAQIATIAATPMAQGGVVPPGYPNDTFPALLTSGEKVLPLGANYMRESKTQEKVVFEIEGTTLVGILEKQTSIDNNY